MKQFLLFGLLLLATTGYAQDVYVNGGADDGGDGTSWATAYNDLTVALNAATPGSNIWVAAGTYTTPDSSSFVIDEELSLYGGFAGTETSVDQADPETNVTILSGDVLGNDPADMSYDSTLMADNNRVLTIVNDTLNDDYSVVIDGITITNGIIAMNATSFNTAFFGGGLYSTATVNVSRVRFTRNRATYGSATGLVFGTASGSTFDNIVTEGNYSTGSGMHYSNSVDNISFTNSAFNGTVGDTISSGMLRPVFCEGFTVDNCTFDGVTTPGVRGAAIYGSFMLDVQIMNSTFTNLSGGRGGAIYLSGDAAIDADSMAISGQGMLFNNTFTNVSGTDRGGAIFTADLDMRVDSCDFTDVTASSIGGAILIGNFDDLRHTYTVDNSTFTNCSAPSLGGAIFAFAGGIDLVLSRSTFTGCSSSTSAGGTLFIQGDVTDRETDTRITDCTILNSTSASSGGAMYITREEVIVEGSTIQGSSANSGNGGGVLIFGGEQKDVTFRNTSFIDNGAVSPLLRGSAVYFVAFGSDSRPIPDSMFVDGCTFSGNQTTQEPGIVSGGAIYVSGDAGIAPYVGITNSQFLNNSSLEGANGGAVYAVNGTEVDIVNSEFSNNSAESGGAFYGIQFITNSELYDTTITGTDTIIDTIPFAFYSEGNTPTFKIARSLFLNNLANNQGGVGDMQAGQVSATNSIFVDNSVTTGSGSGGAFIINGRDDAPLRLENTFVNNTFYNNSDGGPPSEEQADTLGIAGNAIALFQTAGDSNPDSSNVTLTIQNNIFLQNVAEDESIGIERTPDDGEIIIRSLGGNYFNSAQQENIPITQVDDAQDVTNVDLDLEAVFKDPFLDQSDFADLDLIRGDGNPLIDGGTTGPLVPEVDYFGEERDDMPDIGAIEYNGPRVDVAEPISESGLDMEFFPNPTVDQVNIVNNDADITTFTVLVSDAQGRHLTGRKFGTGRNVLDMSQLPRGVYNLSLLIDGKVYSQQIVKN
jgi:hypothetical protein